MDKENEILRAMEFNVLGESVFDIGCLLMCRLAAREVGVRFSEKKMVELEDLMAHLAKATVFSYGVMSAYSKNTIACVLLLAALAGSGLTSTHLHDRVANTLIEIAELTSSQQQVQECYEEMVANLKEFGTRYPGLQNFKRFSKIDHEKLIGKL